MASEDNEPSWLSEDTPLMGSGPAYLQDPENSSVSQSIDNDELKQADIEESVVSKVSKAKAKAKLKAEENWSGDDDSGTTALMLVKSPSKNFFLHFFHWFEFLAVVSCLGVLITQVLPLIVVPYNELGFLQSVLRLYISIFSVTFICVELRVPLGFLKKSQILQRYFSRGFLYTFLAIIGMEEAFSGRISDMIGHASDEFHVAWVPLFMQISSWFVFVIGCVYMLFGICCLQILRDKWDEEYKQKVAEYRSLENEK